MQWILEKKPRIILAGILIVTVPLVCLALFFYFFIDSALLIRGLEQIRMGQNLMLAERIAGHIEEKLDNDIAMGKAYAARRRLVEGLQHGDWAELEGHIKNLVQISSSIERVFITSPAGILLADYPSDPAVRNNDFSDRDWFKGVTAKWEPYVSDYYIRKAKPQRYVFAIAIPVPGDGQRPAGIIVMQPKAGYIADIIGSGADSRTTTYLVDKRGNFIYHSAYPVDRRIELPEIPAVRKLLTGDKGTDKFFDPLSKETVLAGYHPGHDWGWGVVVQFPAKAVESPVPALLLALCVATAVMALIGGYFAYKGAGLLIAVRDTGSALQEERDRSRQYLDVAAVMLCVLDAAGRVVIINPKGAAILGHAIEDIKGKNWFEFFLPERSRDGARKIFARLLAGEREPLMYYEHLVLTKNSEERMVAFSSAAITDAKGTVTGILFSGEDITARKKTEQEREDLIRELQAALEKVKLLSGFLPICSSCKKIRDDSGYWNQIETYIHEHSEAEFSHGICPDCARKIYGDYYKE